VRRVLVTRPQPGADVTARKLVALGFEPIVMPLTETRPVDILEPPDPADFDAVVVTSGAALRHAPVPLRAGLAHLPLFAVGDRTAGIAREMGFARPQSAEGETSALAALVARALPAGSRVAYLCGRVRTGSLAERLRKAGFAATPVETYDTLPVEWTPDAALAAFAGQPVDASLIYSANAAILFSRLLALREAGPLLGAARLLCISARAAGALPPSGQARAEIARTPDEAALLALLGAAE
jgi:uroporphyrinogen-III synthase